MDPRPVNEVAGISVEREEPLANLPGAPFRISRLYLTDGTVRFRCRDCIFVGDSRGSVIAHRNERHGTRTGRRTRPSENTPDASEPDIFSTEVIFSAEGDDTSTASAVTVEMRIDDEQILDNAQNLDDEHLRADTSRDAPPPAAEPDTTHEPLPSSAPWAPLGVILDTYGDRSAMDLTVGDLVAIAPSAKALLAFVQRLELERDDAQRQLAIYRSAERVHAHKIDAYDDMRDELRTLRAWKQKIIARLKPLGFTLTEEDHQQ